MNKDFFKSRKIKTIIAVLLITAIGFGSAILFEKNKDRIRTSEQLTVAGNSTILESKTKKDATDITDKTETTKEENTQKTTSEKKTDAADKKTSKNTQSSKVPATTAASYKKLNAKLDGVNESDQILLQNMLLHILDYPFYVKKPSPSDNWAEYYFENFDCYSNNAYDYAVEHIFAPSMPLFESMEEWYDWQEKAKYVYPTQEQIEKDDLYIDPLKKLHVDDTAGYGVAEEKYVDLILKYVFNQTPDHDYELKAPNGDIYAYHYDGKYYYNRLSGVDVTIPKALFKSSKQLVDGTYVIDAQYVFVDADFDTIVKRNFDFSLVTKPVEVDNQVYWTLYKIKKNK